MRFQKRCFVSLALWGFFLLSPFPPFLPAQQLPPPEADISADQPFRLEVDVDVVVLPVSVTDRDYRAFSGLGKENFEVKEDGVRQKITAVNEWDNPVSVGLVFDASGSMANTIELCKQVVREFFRFAHPEDEYLLIEFNNRPTLLSGFTQQINRIIGYVGAARGGGKTALYDAVYQAIAEMQNARNRRKILLLLSDGADNFSSYKEKDVRKILGNKEIDVQIYTIGVFDMSYGDPWGASRGAGTLEKLSEMSGGRSFVVNNPARLFDVAGKISRELRTQYEIAYSPSNHERDGRWRKVRVKVKRPPDAPKLEVSTRPGYYAPVTIPEPSSQ